MMELQTLVVGYMGTNCYVLINENTKEALVCDPGGNGDKIAEHLKKQNLRPAAILITHGHCDHMDGVEDLKKAFDYEIPVYALEAEHKLIEEATLNLSSSAGYGIKSYRADKALKDGEELTLGGLSFRVIATPGHTPGGCCYYFKQEGVLLSGDTLFRQSVGRTDFPGGSMGDLSRSIKEKLFTLPDDTRVYPGHMEETTIGEEKASNPFII